MSSTKTLTGRFWLVQLSTIAVLGLFVSLGAWQLGRGNVKSEIERITSDRGSEFESISFPLAQLESWRYRKVTMYGRYNPEKQFLLDNQIREGVVGYSVLTPLFISQNNTWVLVDRGWIPLGVGRTVLPDIAFEGKALHVAGSIYVPYDAAYSLGGIADGEDLSWPRRIQFVDYQQLSLRLGETLQPFTLRLDSGERLGFRRGWAAANLSASKHYGYAFQWFAMACALIVLWWFYSIRPILKMNGN